MKIGIDATTITPTKAGIGYYTDSLVRALMKLDDSNDYYLFTHDLNLLKELTLPANFHIYEIQARKGGFRWSLKTVDILRKQHFDVFFSPTNFTFGILFPKTIQVVHDLAPIKVPQTFGIKARLMYRLQLELCIRRATKIVTISHTVEQELHAFFRAYKEKVAYIGIGLHDWTKQPSSRAEQDRVKHKLNLPENYILAVGTLEPRKNYKKIVEGFASFINDPAFEDYCLVIAGKKGWLYTSIFKIIQELGINESVTILGYVAEEDLASLYDLSKGVIMLSLYEGFGFSIIEGLSRGVPVLASDIPVFHEAAGKLGVFTSPTDTNRIANGMKQLVKNPKRHVSTEFFEQYTWDTCAQRLSEIFKSAR